MYEQHDAIFFNFYAITQLGVQVLVSSFDSSSNEHSIELPFVMVSRIHGPPADRLLKLFLGQSQVFSFLALLVILVIVVNFTIATRAFFVGVVPLAV